jgi:hypothetical protein
VYASRRDFLRSTAVTAGGLLRYAARASFDDLSADSRRQLPIHAVHSLESIQIRDLMNRLGSVHVRSASGR